MSDCSNVRSYDNEPPIRGRIEFADGTHWPVTLARHGRKVDAVVLDGVRYTVPGCDYERGYRDGYRAARTEEGGA